MEALDAKHDFNERRVRAMELAAHNKPVSRVADSTSTDGAPAAAAPPSAVNGEAGSSDGARRRRRRRRGRRSGFGGQEGGASAPLSGTTEATAADIDVDSDTDEDELVPDAAPSALTGDPGGSAALEPAHHFSLLQPEERYPSGEAMVVTPSSSPSISPSGEGSHARNDEAAPSSSPSGGGDVTSARDDNSGPEPSDR
jgi:hypothetical protein